MDLVHFGFVLLMSCADCSLNSSFFVIFVIFVIFLFLIKTNYFLLSTFCGKSLSSLVFLWGFSGVSQPAVLSWLEKTN